MHNLKRPLAALLAVICGYLGYALVVVPLVEPPASARQPIAPSPADLEHARTAVTRQRSDLNRLFREGEWELSAPKIIETGQGKLFIEDYTNEPDGTVTLKPCTVVLAAKGEFATAEERDRRAIVLRAPEGAKLKFDAGLDLKRGKFGRLQSGRLLGAVTIRSDQKSPGPEDDLWIETREVELLDDRIVTPHRVEFRLGPNRGSGRELEIQLSGDPGAALGPNPDWGAIQWLELKRDVAVHLESAGRGIIPTLDAPPLAGLPLAAGTAAPDATPVEITCRGKFRFDFAHYVARFFDEVDVLRRNPVGPSDQLNCQRLSLHFAPAGDAPPAPGQMPPLEPDWLEARGNPVIIRSPRSGVHARGQILKYHLRTRRVSLAADREVAVHRPTDELHARELHYELGTGQQLGRFFALGPGFATGLVPPAAGGPAPSGGGQPQRFEARFEREMRLEPHEGAHVLSLRGRAHAAQPGLGGLDGEEIHVWIVAAPPVAGQGQAGRPRYQPDRILAIGNVVLASAKLGGSVDKLQVWIEHAPAVAEAVSRAARGERPPAAGALAALTGAPRGRAWRSLAAPGQFAPREVLLVEHRKSAPPAGLRTARSQPATVATLSPQQAIEPRPGARTDQLEPPHTLAPPLGPDEALPAEPLPAPPPEPRAMQPATAPPAEFHIDAQLLQVELAVANGEASLKRAHAENHVRFRQQAVADPAQQPLNVAGDGLHLEQPIPGAMLLAVWGQPAEVEARGLALAGGTIHADRAANRVWIDGPGRLTLPVSRDLDGSPLAAPRPLVITWQEKMDFDGQLAQFHREVCARLERQRLDTGLLEALLAQRIDFSAPQQQPTGQRSELERLLCHQGVHLARETLVDGHRESVEHIQVAELLLNQQTGDVDGQGPGWVRTVRLGGEHSLPFAADRSASAPPPQTPGGDAQLTYLGIDFQRGLVGNLHTRELTFQDQVKTVYAPVPGWDTAIDPYADPRELGSRAMRLESEELTVAQMPGYGGRKPGFEIVASRNVIVEGALFQGRAHRATYAEAKDRLVLEGSGRTPATLSRQETPGGPEATVTAGKFSYWIGSGQWRIDDGRSIDPGRLPAN